MEFLSKDFPLLLPIVLIQLAFQIIALVDLFKKDIKEIRWENKVIWGIVIVLFGILGPILYFTFGRK